MNVLAVDLESWVHKYFVQFDDRPRMEKDAGYVRRATAEVLDILRNHGVKTTFFIVSEIYEWYPDLVEDIAGEGHEIGFHSHTHRILRKTRDLTKELSLGGEFIDEYDIKGFRAPQIFMRFEYLKILKDRGFTYDSSVYSPFQITTPVDGVFEVPISTYPLLTRKNREGPAYPRNLSLRLMAKEIPFGSGFFIGLLGNGVSWFIRNQNHRGIPASLFIHNWQVRPVPTPVQKQNTGIGGRMMMVPYERNRRDTLESLLKNFQFSTMTKLINKFKHGN